jgi:hypothetical protein
VTKVRIETARKVERKIANWERGKRRKLNEEGNEEQRGRSRKSTCK